MGREMFWTGRHPLELVRQATVAGHLEKDQSAGHRESVSQTGWLRRFHFPQGNADWVCLPHDSGSWGRVDHSLRLLPGPYSQEDISSSHFILSVLWNQSYL